jgi:hypothetical protein
MLPNPRVKPTNSGELRPPSFAAYAQRYAALSRGELLRGAQQRMMAHGQDIPPQGAAEIF